MAMKMLALLGALLAIPAAAAAQPPAPIALAPGEAISLSIGADGAVAAGPRERGDWTPFDLAAARHLSGQPIPDQPVPYASPIPGTAAPLAPPVAPNMVRVKLLSVAGQHTLLALANGYDRALAYRARITRDGRTNPTDVCLVLPNRHGFEYWPYRIERIELSELHLVPWKDGQAVPCV